MYQGRHGNLVCQVHCTNCRNCITYYQPYGQHCVRVEARGYTIQFQAWKIISGLHYKLSVSQLFKSNDVNNAMITTPRLLVFKTFSFLILFFFFFSGTLAENNRLRLVHNVVVAFAKLMSAARGEVLCSITTAKVCSNDYYYYSTITPFHHIRSPVLVIWRRLM